DRGAVVVACVDGAKHGEALTAADAVLRAAQGAAGTGVVSGQHAVETHMIIGRSVRLTRAPRPFGTLLLGSDIRTVQDVAAAATCGTGLRTVVLLDQRAVVADVVQRRATIATERRRILVETRGGRIAVDRTDHGAVTAADGAGMHGTAVQ